jgi:hypothetical protein
MFKTLINTVERLKCWRRKNSNYRLSRKQSDYRAVSMAEKLVASGTLQTDRLSGLSIKRTHMGLKGRS